MPLLLYGFFSFASSRQPCFGAEVLDTMTDGRLITKMCTQATAGIKLLPTESEYRLVRHKYVMNECCNVVVGWSDYH